MAIMVDELRVWPNARRPFHNGSCHLTTDSALDELHAFARVIGMRRSWFQDHAIAPHYDLTPSRREEALRRGAVFMPMREHAVRRRAALASARQKERA
jgi:hypothetical protein